jgi:hypothetical protein
MIGTMAFMHSRERGNDMLRAAEQWRRAAELQRGGERRGSAPARPNRPGRGNSWQQLLAALVGH